MSSLILGLILVSKFSCGAADRGCGGSRDYIFVGVQLFK